MDFYSDYLVIGSGIAGLYFALKASEQGSVIVLTKKQRAESNTNYAQGGISAAIGADDSFELHIEDTLRAGAGLCHRDAVELMVRTAPHAIAELERLGVEFTRTNGRLDLGREGGHSRNRIVHAQDATGRAIERALLSALAQRPSVTICEHAIAVELITEHHFRTSSPHRTSSTCFGIYALTPSGSVDRYFARATVLATGGCGQVYAHTTNPTIATGDGIAMAYRAGAAIGNMEFIQFHPTALYEPDRQGPAFLISEAVRGAGAILRNSSGERFMLRYDERAELAPRDIVARAIDNELKTRGERCVWLDVRHLDGVRFRNQFPTIVEECAKRGIHLPEDMIPVVPAAHYCCGGVVTDLNGKTTIERLFACGEVACTGVHGANRLASNSLLEGIVFAERAATYLALHPPPPLGKEPELVAPWDDSGTQNTEEWVLIAHDRDELQAIMWDYVGIVRSELRLQRALRRIELLRSEIEDFYCRTKLSPALIELRNLATVAWIITRSALHRKESRGLHTMSDYPQSDDTQWRCDTIICGEQVECRPLRS
ncbi:MAG: L-aspartate oxidase [Candidatus Kapabacteria bacterium]|nr:L-aspartate oxidase [Candidatus Kapabacteria bacterium]